MKWEKPIRTKQVTKFTVEKRYLESEITILQGFETKTLNRFDIISEVKTVIEISLKTA
jgi:hypothetical protein